MTEKELVDRARRLSHILDDAGVTFADQAVICGAVLAATIAMVRDADQRRQLISAHLLALRDCCDEAREMLRLAS